MSTQKPQIIGIDYGSTPATSTEVEGYRDKDGVLRITAIRSWRHELELEAEEIADEPYSPRALGQG